MKRMSGFTLIELIMVIVILGILSAFALPRFADMSNDARLASLDGAAGSLRSAMNIAHAQYLADGSSGTSVSLDGQTVNLVFGYPAATATGIGTAVDASGYTATADATATPPTYTLAVQTDCQVVYTEAANATTLPTIASTTTGC
ncbi:type II secretion system protein [Oceanobacter mangrovi]|uniref:type II secretion system protein n=1 Tax=Oceanobacter mangrovi TaxID=2862510 RepID=UPI001C8D7313|nr:type II secretion system protein [Oceanobacter mangrovi]